jgi:hypothetical protein
MRQNNILPTLETFRSLFVVAKEDSPEFELFTKHMQEANLQPGSASCFEIL